MIPYLLLATLERKKLGIQESHSPEITDTFIDNGSMPLSLSDESLIHLQRFVILLYDRTSECSRVDQCIEQLFSKGRQIDRIPPTEAALKEHIKRTVYQVGVLLGSNLCCTSAVTEPWRMGMGKTPRRLLGCFLDATSQSSKGVQRANRKLVGHHANVCLFYVSAHSFESAGEPVIDICPYIWIPVKPILT